jgi:NADPH:quinone reductase-like Zn-dependent oxidoreductase
MKAAIYNNYGPPEVLQISEMDKPICKENEVLIKVYAATVTATDCTFRKGEPFFARLYTGLTKPKQKILGSEFVGKIEIIGSKVKTFKVGDRVVGTTPGYGAYSEYLTLQPEKSTIAKIPEDRIDEAAISCCDGFLTSLPFLRDKGKIEKGNKVLIVGASGSVGSAAVQLSKYFDAEVTGVCSSSSEELVRSIGADRTIDYTKVDFTKANETYDIIFDLTGKISFSECKNNLEPKGKFLQAAITMSVFPSVLWSAMFGSKKALIMATGLRPPVERTKDLIFIGELLDESKIKPVIDKKYPFEQISDAHKYVDAGHKKGNVLLIFE